ncbi:superoxide dismutase, Ni [Candidatus Curtissbacteria bacterium RIFCSPHIGHO2_01_FULL_41_11]|uniref:Superoxide dismutase, Ni n=1 Tax=Candidatus Curtissbacteria bacterium RIFCSPHIGHO2_01_FULL_41_11 TaxID=1797711 RepID=A0A1F5G7M2_9BACT|nr:MAG: superoxide dismutase, Ni [Candidatus Curtissbacteria bacterium RIFCSPHIGHO2_01_FULL_41_11]
MKFFKEIFKIPEALAHCDIPCGIYETNTLLVSAQTVIRMVEVMESIPMDKPSLKDRNNFIRCVRVKEDHAQICEEQLVTLWADFFKPEHIAQFPDLHDKVWRAIKLASENKLDVNIQKAKELLVACREVAAMFDQVKVEPKEDLSGSVSDNPDAFKKKLLG